nr:WD40 repeat domain containing protein [Haemonchus contortus]
MNEFCRKADDDVIYWKRMQQLAVLQEPASVSSIAFSPNKPYNVASTSSVRLSLYDTIVCEPINMFSRFKRAVCGVKFRRDGELLAVGGEEGKARIFDLTQSSGIRKDCDERTALKKGVRSSAREGHFSPMYKNLMPIMLFTSFMSE